MNAKFVLSTVSSLAAQMSALDRVLEMRVGTVLGDCLVGDMQLTGLSRPKRLPIPLPLSSLLPLALPLSPGSACGAHTHTHPHAPVVEVEGHVLGRLHPDSLRGVGVGGRREGGA